MEEIRSRIVNATSKLIDDGGLDAATTRAIAAAASVQAPTVYRLFGDKRSLLDAVAQHGLSSYVTKKSARNPHIDPAQELRDGWDMYVEFSLSHPGLFLIMATNPHPLELSPAAAAGKEILRKRVKNMALLQILPGKIETSYETCFSVRFSDYAASNSSMSDFQNSL